MKRLSLYIKEPWRWIVAFDRHILSIVPDKLYLKSLYRCLTGRKLNLKNPKTFCEKMQWLKLYDKHPEYTQLVDKLLVRNNVSQILGEEYLIPLLGKWKSFDEIDFSKLPDQFVLKCNHDSGSTKIIDKSELSEEKTNELRLFYTERLKNKFDRNGREYPYRGIKKYIIAEKYMISNDDSQNILNDYKFLCFNGIPKIMFVATDRFTDCKFDFFDMSFNHLPIVNTHPNSTKAIKKPLLFDEMIEISRKLSQNKPFVRIDLYEINGRIYFGEYTFFHCGGVFLFKPDEWEQKLGDWIMLPGVDERG